MKLYGRNVMLIEATLVVLFKLRVSFLRKKQAQPGSATFEEGVPYAEAEHLFPLTMFRGLPNIDGTDRLNIGEGETKLTLIHAAVAFSGPFRLSY